MAVAEGTVVAVAGMAVAEGTVVAVAEGAQALRNAAITKSNMSLFMVSP
jgi:hypothetical protein